MFRYKKSILIIFQSWGGSWCTYETDKDAGYTPAAHEFIPEHEVMKSIPFFGFDAPDNGIVGPFFGNGFSGCDGDEEAGFGAFLVEFWGDGAFFEPFVGVGGYVLGWG